MTSYLYRGRPKISNGSNQITLRICPSPHRLVQRHPELTPRPPVVAHLAYPEQAARTRFTQLVADSVTATATTRDYGPPRLLPLVLAMVTAAIAITAQLA
ncbi:hypothetical protein ACFLV0_06225 [Chloroflexota bacterium]